MYQILEHTNRTTAPVCGHWLAGIWVKSYLLLTFSNQIKIIYIFNPAQLIVVYRLHNIDVVNQNESYPACCKIDGFDPLRDTCFVHLNASQYVLSYVHLYVVHVSPISPQIMRNYIVNEKYYSYENYYANQIRSQTAFSESVSQC